MTIARPIDLDVPHETLETPRAAPGFSASDLAWERCQEQAALAFQAGDAAGAARLWAQGLEIARQHFGRGDPRLAASLTNQALVMRRQRQDYQAKQLFEQAITAWGETWRWIHLMTPQPAGAAMRPEGSNQLEVYDAASRSAFSELAERGRAASMRLERHDELPRGGLEEWRAIKPRRLTDLRKLLAAVLLIASKPA